jgi:hypothetical protein
MWTMQSKEAIISPQLIVTRLRVARKTWALRAPKAALSRATPSSLIGPDGVSLLREQQPEGQRIFSSTVA